MPIPSEGTPVYIQSSFLHFEIRKISNNANNFLIPAISPGLSISNSLNPAFGQIFSFSLSTTLGTSTSGNLYQYESVVGSYALKLSYQNSVNSSWYTFTIYDDPDSSSSLQCCSRLDVSSHSIPFICSCSIAPKRNSSNIPALGSAFQQHYRVETIPNEPWYFANGNLLPTLTAVIPEVGSMLYFNLSSNDPLSTGPLQVIIGDSLNLVKRINVYSNLIFEIFCLTFLI